MRTLFVALLLIVVAACQSTSVKQLAKPDSANTKAAKINTAAGAQYINLGEYKVALQKLQKALLQDPGLPAAHNTIAVLYQRLKKHQKAEYHFKQAVQRAPDYSEAQNNYGVFLCENGHYQESEQRFLTAISDPLYPNSAQAYENAGLCVDKIPDTTLAEHYLLTALQLDPYLTKSLLKLAELNYQNIDYLAANSYIERYKAITPWTPQALLLAIKIASKLADKDKVASYAILLKGQFPDSTEALEVRQGNYIK